MEGRAPNRDIEVVLQAAVAPRQAMLVEGISINTRLVSTGGTDSALLRVRRCL